MSYKKIVYIRPGPFTKFIYNSLYIENLQKSGIEVEYLDTSLLYSKNTESEEFLGFKSVVKIDFPKKFEEYLINQDKSKTFFIYLTSFNYKSFRLFVLLKKHNCKLGFFARYAKQPINVKTNLNQKLEGFKRKLKNRIGMRLAYYYKQLGFLKSYDYIFVGGNKSIDYFFKGYFFKKDRQKAKIININASDYDTYLLTLINAKVPEEPYILFLDQFLPYHPDFVILEKKSINPETYFRDLNRTFDKLEKKFNTKIVIAAHPKAFRYKKFNPFDGRATVFEKTAELVAKSQLVLMHYSTSINFAILYKKPIVLLTSEEFQQILPSNAQFQKEISRSLGCSIINYDDHIKEINLEINQSKYLEYKYNYMTSTDSERRKTSDIIIDFLKHPK